MFEGGVSALVGSVFQGKQTLGPDLWGTVFDTARDSLGARTGTPPLAMGLPYGVVWGGGGWGGVGKQAGVG